MAALKLADKMAASAVPVAQLARLGLPALAGTLAFAVLVLAAVCWLLGSDDRTDRAARLLQAWRAGTASTSGTAPALPGPPPRRKRPRAGKA